MAYTAKLNYYRDRFPRISALEFNGMNRDQILEATEELRREARKAGFEFQEVVGERAWTIYDHEKQLGYGQLIEIPKTVVSHEQAWEQYNTIHKAIEYALNRRTGKPWMIYEEE